MTTIEKCITLVFTSFLSHSIWQGTSAKASYEIRTHMSEYINGRQCWPHFIELNNFVQQIVKNGKISYYINCLMNSIFQEMMYNIQNAIVTITVK